MSDTSPRNKDALLWNAPKSRDDGPTPREVLGTLWTMHKGGRTMTCLVVAAPTGEELRVLLNNEMYWTEVLPDRGRVVVRAEILRRQLEARDWVPDAQRPAP